MLHFLFSWYARTILDPGVLFTHVFIDCYVVFFSGEAGMKDDMWQITIGMEAILRKSIQTILIINLLKLVESFGNGGKKKQYVLILLVTKLLIILHYCGEILCWPKCPLIHLFSVMLISSLLNSWDFKIHLGKPSNKVSVQSAWLSYWSKVSVVNFQTNWCKDLPKWDQLAKLRVEWTLFKVTVLKLSISNLCLLYKFRNPEWIQNSLYLLTTRRCFALLWDFSSRAGS